MKNKRKQVLFSKVLLTMATSFFVGGPGNFAVAEIPLDRVAIVMQSLTVKGTVGDVNGESIIGASVVVKSNTTLGTITDLDGNFELTNVPAQGMLIVSYVGYKTKEVAYTQGRALKIVLEEDTETLDEVVVVGYGTQKKANLTGSVTSVNFDELATMPVANTTNMLQGRLPGVVLTGNGAQAGYDTPEIRIRGVGSIGSGSKNNPMVLIDGVESSISQIADLPADDIASVSVLKDAASAAIYGVRAANGVILVTTKRGTEQAPSIIYSGSIALQKATILPDYVNSYEWAKMYNEAQPTKAYTAEMLEALRIGSDPDHFANTDWAKEIFRTAPMHQHHLSVTGGSRNVHYMISTQYFKQEGIAKNTANQRFNFRSNLDAKLGIVKIGLNLSGSRQSIEEPTTSVSGDGILRYLTWYTRPTVPVKYSNNHYGYVDGNPLISATVFKNPIYAIYNGYKDNKHYRFDGQFFGEIDIWKGLKFRSSLAYKYYMNDTSTYTPKGAAVYDAEGNELIPAGTMNSLKDYHYLETTYINENILTYNNRIGKHEFSVLLGHSIQGYRYDSNTAGIQNFPTENIYELNGGSQNPSVSGSAEESAMQSFFGRINYNYDGRYLFEANVRRDGSSRLPKDNRYATFPSFSAAWLISSESFMEDIDWLSSLKLRASWGKLGNQEIGDYAYVETMAALGGYYFGDEKYIGMRKTKIANEDIKWETTAITDIGLDASFLQSRINVAFDWYDKTTSDILLQLPMPNIFLGSLGAPYQNAGKVRNRGWELSINYNDGVGDWQWQAGVSLAGVKNQILDMKGQESIGNHTINREGEAIDSYYGLKALGIYRTEEDLTRYPAIINGQTPQLGDVIYEDFDQSGNITEDGDRQIIGNPFPKLQYSCNLGFSWKDLDVTTFWQGIAGLNRFSWDETVISNGGNKTSRWLDRWSPENPNGRMPRLGNTNNDIYSSFWLTKSDYLRLKNIEIGYTFRNKTWISKMGIKSLRLYLAATNLLTLTPLEDYDPEKQSSDTRNDVHPNTKTCSFGVNVKF